MPKGKTKPKTPVVAKFKVGDKVRTSDSLEALIRQEKPVSTGIS